MCCNVCCRCKTFSNIIQDVDDHMLCSSHPGTSYLRVDKSMFRRCFEEAVAFSLLGRAPTSRAGILGSRPDRCDGVNKVNYKVFELKTSLHTF